LDYWIIFSLSFLLFLGVADNQTLVPLLHSVVSSLRISMGRASLLVVAYSLAAGVAAFLSGSLSDHYGRRRFLRIGVLVFALASWAASRSETFAGLLAARALTGLGAGTLSTCAFAFAGDWFAYSVRGKAIGWISSSYFAALIFGVPIASLVADFEIYSKLSFLLHTFRVPIPSLVADRFGWHRAFLFFSILGFAAACVALRLPKDRLSRQPAPRKVLKTLRTFRSFLTRRDTAAMLAIAFMVSGGLMGFMTYIGVWLNNRFGLPTRTIGLVIMLGGVVAVAGAPLGGIISDRWGKRVVSIASNVLLAVAVALVPLPRWGIWLLIVFGATSLGAAFRQGPLTALMTEMVPMDQRGSFVALRNISSQLGIGAVAFAGGVLYEHYGYEAVTTLCASMTALVAILLLTHIAEPQAVVEGAYRKARV
jgi:predicted MFS family arabinose efflux permease